MNNPKGVFIFFGCGILFLIGSLIAGAIDGVGFMLVSSILAVSSFVVLTKLKKNGDHPENHGNDSSTRISKLHDLLKSGALTQEEFESEKRKILQRVA